MPDHYNEVDRDLLDAKGRIMQKSGQLESKLKDEPVNFKDKKKKRKKDKLELSSTDTAMFLDLIKSGMSASAAGRMVWQNPDKAEGTGSLRRRYPYR